MRGTAIRVAARPGRSDEGTGDIEVEAGIGAMDKRKDFRFKTRFEALYSAGRADGTAELVDLSYAGARLQLASLQLALGTKVRLHVFIQPVQAFELTGHVIRSTEDGFAIQLDVSDAELRSLVDDVAAIVAEPRHP